MRRGSPAATSCAQPHELRDGAHNPAGAAHLARSLGPLDAVLVVSLVADKDVDGVLRELAPLGRTLVATASTSGRALAGVELAARAGAPFAHVESVPDPAAALVRARELAGARRDGSRHRLAVPSRGSRCRRIDRVA